MLKPFATERLAVRQLQIQDAPELTRINDTPAVSQWMAFMEGGFPLEKAEALIASQNETKECFFSVRLPDGTLIGAMGCGGRPLRLPLLLEILVHGLHYDALRRAPLLESDNLECSPCLRWNAHENALAAIGMAVL